MPENDDTEIPESQAAGRAGAFRRRRLVRNALLYMASAWVTLQFVDLVFPLVGLNESAVRWVLWMLGAGLAMTIGVSWLAEVRVQRGEAPIAVLSTQTVAIAVLLLLAGGFAGAKIDPWLEERKAGMAPKMAVIPFTTRAGDGALSELGDELGHDVTNALARFEGVEIFIASSDHEGSPAEAATELGASFALTGHVQIDDERIRVRARLIDATSGAVAWSETYDRALPAESLLDLQQEVAGRIAATVADRSGVIRRATRVKDVADSNSHRHVDECIALADEYFTIHTDAQHAAARRCLELAVDREPENAEAWAHLAYLYREEHLHHRNERLRPLQRALRAAEIAIQHDPQNAMAHFALATIHFSRGAFDAARIAAERAIALNQNDAAVLGLLSLQFAASGDWETALTAAHRATELNPNHPPILHNAVALDHYQRGDYEAALVAHRRITSLDTVRGVTRAAILGRLGRAENALDVLDVVAERDPHFAADPLGELYRIYISEELVDGIAEGLRMAGFDLDPTPRYWETPNSYGTRSRGHRTKTSKDARRPGVS